MSASIMWKRVKPEGKALGVSAPSNFIETMRRAFGEGPWVLTDANIERVQGMADAYGGRDEDNPYVKLVALLGEGDAIRIWAEY